MGCADTREPHEQFGFWQSAVLVEVSRNREELGSEVPDLYRVEQASVVQLRDVFDEPRWR